MRNLKDHRVMTALVTPLTPEGQLDRDSLTHLVRLQEEANNAILLLGSTGEALAMSLAEKQAVLEHVFSLKPKVATVVGVGGFQLPEQLAWINYCQSTFALDGFLLVTPLYAKPGIQGQTAWFKALMDAVKAPCILYNIPGRSAVKLHFEVVEALRSHPNFFAVKESSGDAKEFAGYCARLPNHTVYSGSDECLAEELKMGAFGEISVASNIWAKEINRYITLCLAGQNTPAQDQLWIDASLSLFLASNPVPIKAILAQEGLIKHPDCLPPLTHLDLSQESLAKIAALSVRMKQEFAA